MTPEQAVLHLILLRHAEFSGTVIPENPTGDQVVELYGELVENDEHWEAMSDVREGEAETDIEATFSRHYESKSVAAKTPEGRWVGWTYWYGGGKHGAPEEIEWLENAYFLDCKEEQKTVTVRTFTKSEEQAA